jgi:hypothetical protein
MADPGIVRKDEIVIGPPQGSHVALFPDGPIALLPDCLRRGREGD